jgi:phage tail sheath gpL-like
MTEVSFPAVTTTISGAVTQVSQQPQKILVVSQKTAAGTATSGALNENIQSNADTLAGEASFGASVVRAVRGVNEDTQVDAIFLDDNGAGVAATGTIAFTGTATAAGELTVIIASERNHTLSVAVAIGDTATDVGDTLAAAILADTKIPVTSVNTTGSVALTATNDGTAGNDMPMEVRGSVAGISVALTAMASGATDPALTGVFDVVGETRYQTILWTWADSTTELTTFVDGRFNVTDDILDGLGYVGKADTLANHLSAVGALNSFIVYIADEVENTAEVKGAALLEMGIVSSAYAGALRALKLTEGAAIASLNAGESGLDGIGGPALASRPLANTPVFEMIPMRQGRGWEKLEIKQLNDVGASVIGNNRAANQIVLGEQLTTRNTSGGSPDDSFKFVNYFDTSVNIREFYSNNLRSRYAQSRLTDGSPVAGRPMANQRNIEAALIEFYDTLSGAQFVLTRAGEDNRNFFIGNLVVSLNLQTGVVTWSAKSPIVTQIREISGNIQIVFATTQGSFTV